jgi:hypothetical protein
MADIPSETRLIGDADLPANATLLDFWQWAFGDICDDDLKGYFAEWMVCRLIGLPQPRRVSWADSDLITPKGTRIEVKASAYWQSWKLVNEDGSRKPIPPAVDAAKTRISFRGLMSGPSVSPVSEPRVARFKSVIYVFCLHAQTDATAWDAWQLSHWQFHVLTLVQLQHDGVGSSISLARVRKLCPPMTAQEFQRHMRQLITSIEAETR